MYMVGRAKLLQSVFVACCLILILTILPVTLGSAAFASPIAENNGSQGDEFWYVGKGLKVGTFVKYSIQENKTNDGKPFDMTLYFKDFNNASNYWTTSIYVNASPNSTETTDLILNGTLNLNGDVMSILPNSNASSDIEPYKLAYANTLDWPSAFFQKPGIRLGSAIGSVGRYNEPPLTLDNTSENITTAAGNFNTTVYRWNGAFSEGDYKIWLNVNQPFPVKGKIISLSSSATDPTKVSVDRIYSFELLAYGQSKQDPPEALAMPEFAFNSLSLFGLTLPIMLILVYQRANRIK